MPPPVMSPPTDDPFVAGIQSSASAIYDERKRLNDAFAALQAALSVLRPGMVLLDNGEVKGTGLLLEPPSPEAIEAAAQATAEAAAAEPAAPPEPEPSPVPPSKPSKPAPLGDAEGPTLKERVLAVLQPGERKTSPRIAAEIGHDNEASIRSILAKLRNDGKVVRIVDTPYWMRAAEVVSRPSEPEPKAGIDLPGSDVSPSTTSPSLGDKQLQLPDEERQAEGEGEEPTARVKPKATTSTSVQPASSPDDRGLSRSPKPRSEMKQQQREAEERRDMLVVWLSDQPDTRGNANDAADELGLRRDRVSSDFRELLQRGVFALTGNQVHSKEALKLDPIKRGRTSPEYVLAIEVGEPPKGEARPETPEVEAPEAPARAQPEDVDKKLRDAIIELRTFNFETLAAKLGIEAADDDGREALRGRVMKFIERGMIAPHEHDTWRYVKPTDPGAAARLDMERTAEERLAVERTEGSLPVEGTGRSLLSSHPEVKRIVEIARRSPVVERVFKQGNDHIAVKFRDRPIPIRIASTPNNAGLVQDKNRLRKAGLASV